MAVSRRDFLARTALAGGAAFGMPALSAQAKVRRAAPALVDAPIRWLDESPPARHDGLTWGVPWPRGTKRANAAFAMRDAEGRPLAVQSWTTATWPDGSIKWTAHAIPGDATPGASSRIGPGRAAAAADAIRVAEQAAAIEVSTGPGQWRIAQGG